MSNGGGIGDDKEDTNLVGSSFSLVRSLLLIIYHLQLDQKIFQYRGSVISVVFH